MSQAELQAIADGILIPRGILGYVVVLSMRKLTGGHIIYNRKRIVVSGHMPTDAQRNTILHECAHAVAYHKNAVLGRAHGWLWRSVARELGAKPYPRTAPVTEAVVLHRENVRLRRRTAPRVTIQCVNCGVVTDATLSRWTKSGSRFFHRGLCRGRFVLYVERKEATG